MTPDASLVAWDGLSLRVPPGTEPASLGQGYMLLEDGTGPRLELRWRPAGRKFSLEKALARAGMVRTKSPGPLQRAALSLLPQDAPAAACAPKRDPARPCLLRLLPAGRLAVVAGFFPESGGVRPEKANLPASPRSPLSGEDGRPDGPSGPYAAAPCAPPSVGDGQPGDGSGQPATGPDVPLPLADEALALAVASLDDCRPLEVCLYDIALRLPEGFSLAGFSLRLGEYRLLFRDRRRTLEYARFAPAQAVLRGKTLDQWAGAALKTWAGRGQHWRAAPFGDRQAASLRPLPSARAPSLAARLLARLRPGDAPVHALAWPGDASRILAVRAAGTWPLSPAAFEAICRDYVVSSQVS